MQRFWHRVRENKTARLPFRFVCVDTETIEEKLDALHSIHRLRFGCATYFSTPQGERKQPERDDLDFIDASVFWDWVEAHAAANGRIILSAHNLAFDFLVLDTAQQLKRRGWSVDFPVSGNGRFITSARKGKCRLYFIDTLNYVMTTLREIGESLGLHKMRMPANDAPAAAWFKYCRRDTEIVVRFWQTLIEFLRRNDFGSFAPTAASLAYKIFRHRFLTSKLLVHNYDRALLLERAAFLGGRNECYRIGKLSGERFYLLDVNSLYPSVMRHNNFPTVFVGYLVNVPVSILRQRMRNYFCIARVILNTRIARYPLRDSVGLVFPVGRFESALTQPELKAALDAGAIVKVLELAFYKRADIFTPFVKELYSLRRQFKRTGNFAFDLFAKMLLNSLYGKFGQRGYKRKRMPRNRSIRYGHIAGYSKKWHSHFDITYWDGVGYLDYQAGEAMESMPAISAAVTGYGRSRLWQLMRKAGLPNIFYVDTDSLIVNAAGLEKLRGEIAPDKLGKLKIVDAARTVILRGVKDYQFRRTVKRKGIKHSAVEICADLFEQVRFASFLENVRAGRVDGVEMHTERKAITRDYDKGLVGAGGVVAPIAFDCFAS